MNGHAEAVSALIAAGATVDVGDWQSVTPLMAAAQSGSVEAVKVILEQPGRRMNVVDCNGWAALHFACSAGQSAIASLLAARGARIDTPYALSSLSSSMAQ